MSGEVIKLSSRLTRQQQKWMVEALPIVRQIAAPMWWRCRHGVLGFEDLLSIGNIKAAELLPEFDPSRGTLRRYLWRPVHGVMCDASSVDALCGTAAIDRAALRKGHAS